jgi:hypothetical protein
MTMSAPFQQLFAAAVVYTRTFTRRSSNLGGMAAAQSFERST